MKIGIISNSELCIPLLHDLQTNNIETAFYLAAYSGENLNIPSLISFCNASNILVEEEKNKEQLYLWLHKQNPDYAFIFGYRNLIDIDKLEEYNKKVFNIHPGKLPDYRGPNPIFWQIKKGAATIGLTIHLLNSKFDSGPIVWVKEIKNEPHFTHGLVDLLFSNFLIEGVHYIINSFNIEDAINSSVLQDESKYAYYKKPTLKDVLIDWKVMTAEEIINLVKACNPWNKGAITVYKNMEIKIVDAEIVDNPIALNTSGAIVDISDGIKVVCCDNKLIKINHFNINGIFVPARFADKFGVTEDSGFESP